MDVLPKLSRDVRIEEDVAFETLVQNKDVLRGLEQAGYSRPSPIQLRAIPIGRLGVDLIAQAKSGTGKTIVFSVIALEMIDLNLNELQVLMVAPTREIAIQIRDVIRNVGKYLKGFQCEAIIGGLDTQNDAKKMRHCQVIVGTPGRLMASIHKNLMKTQSIRLLVLDEADRLMDEAFQRQTRYIDRHLPRNKQCLAFSATFSEDLLNGLRELTNNPEIVRLTADVPELEEVQQYYKRISVEQPPDDKEFQRNLRIYKAKFEASADLLSKIPFYQCMIFVNSVPRAIELSKWLTEMGWASGYISGGLDQVQRMSVMEKMRQFKLRVLVCSDLIARGIDIDRVNLVINMDYPRDVETYMHRVGRSGRYGTSGIAVNLVASRDEQFLEQLKERGLHILPLPENVSYSEFRKVLSENEEKALKAHQKKRSEKETEPLSFTNLDKKLRKSGPSSMKRSLNQTDQDIPERIDNAPPRPSKRCATAAEQGKRAHEEENQPMPGAPNAQEGHTLNPPSACYGEGYPTFSGFPPFISHSFYHPLPPPFPFNRPRQTQTNQTHFIPPDLFF